MSLVRLKLRVILGLSVLLVFLCVFVLDLLYKIVICEHLSLILFKVEQTITNPKLLQKDFLLKHHALGEYCTKAVRFGAKTPQTKYLGALLTASLIYLIPAPLSRSGRAVSVQPADKHSSIFCARSVIDLQFVCCHLPFSSRLSSFCV